jgi:hypothetical protein
MHPLDLGLCSAQGNLVHIQEKVGSREHFPLPSLGPKLEACREEVRIGRGFQLLRCVLPCLRQALPQCGAGKVVALLKRV